MPRKNQYFGGIIGASPLVETWDGVVQYLIVGGGGVAGTQRLTP